MTAGGSVGEAAARADLGTKSSERHRINVVGWARWPGVLHVVDRAELRIEGEIAIRNGIEVHAGDVTQRVYLGRLYLRSTDGPTVDGRAERNGQDSDGAYGHILLRSARYEQREIELHVSVNVSAALLEKLTRSSPPPEGIFVSGHVMTDDSEGSGYSIRLKEEGDCGLGFENVRMSLMYSDAAAPGWIATAHARAAAEALKDLCLGLRFGQVKAVVDEFAGSLVHVATDERQELLAKIREVVTEAQAALLADIKRPDGGSWFHLTPSAQREALARLSKPERERIEKMLSTLWQHFSVPQAVAHGEKERGAAKAGLQPKVEEIERAAAALCALSDRGVSSQFLEWALIDALVYAETIAFAQTVVSGKTVLGMPVPGELDGVMRPSNMWKRWFREVGALAGRGLMEVIIIFVTFIFAMFLSNEDRTIAWIITVGVTGTRWVRAAVIGTRQTPEQKQWELMTQMAGAHEHLKTPHFNPGLVRDTLRSVSEKGAVFSPWVFNLLDQRIARDSARAQAVVRAGESG